jgi:hypothetical protein
MHATAHLACVFRVSLFFWSGCAALLLLLLATPKTTCKQRKTK